MKRYAADFETITTSPTRVWAWGISSIEDGDFSYGTDIEGFLEKVSRETCICYFHNLKFDGMFILDWCFRNGWEWSKKLSRSKQFNTLIGDLGQWYSMKIKFGRNTVTFYDSLKLLPMPIEDMPKAFGLSLKKLDLDYDEEREIGHQLTDKEISYLKNDVMILQGALKIMLEEGHTKMTISSNAYADLKKSIEEGWDLYYPTLELSVDADCRKSYKGGWTYVNPVYQNKMVEKGQVYDVNSMYPHVMRDKMLPYGEAIYYTGKYEYDPLFPLYICVVEVELRLKKNKYPSIQVKHSLFYSETEYIIETGCPTLLHLTSVDYELMLENYDVLSINHLCGYKFRGTIGLFAKYIDKWYKRKSESKKQGNNAMATIAKLFLNGSYGKIGSNPIKKQKIPYFDYEKNIVRFTMSDEEISNTGYVPVASFITSWARDIIIRAANSCGDRFLYADTDSLHILGKEKPNIDIDEYRLGAFKLESVFEQAKYLRAKCYIEENEGYMDKKCAGLPKACRDELNFDTLKTGQSFDGKLLPKTVPGGVILESTKFRIK